MKKRELFRKLVAIADTISIWFDSLTGFNAKRKVLEAKQDLVSYKELEETIGKALGVKRGWTVDIKVKHNG